MADLIRVIDSLWFHQIILFPESTTTLLVTRTIKQQSQFAQDSSFTSSSSSLSLSTTLPSEEVSSSTPPEDEFLSGSSLDVDFSNYEVDREVTEDQDRPTILDNPIKNRARSHSSSPSTTKRPSRHSSAARRRLLQKSMSCRSLRELELEEVKGFMDLGFMFNKEHISPRILSLVPGLQRLRLNKNYQNKKINDSEVAKDDKLGEVEEEEERKGVIRPYLSEAWTIKRPDSPMLNLRVPRVSAAADMKKHLRIWARTVASVIQQES